MENQDLNLMAMSNHHESNDDQVDEDFWCSLPPEILSLILSKLIGGDKLIFQAVCKTWQSITNIAPPRPLPLPQLPSQSHDPCPWLFLINKAQNTYRFIHPMYNYYTCEMDLPAQLSNTEIRYSNHGWVLLMTHNTYNKLLFLFNLFTKEIIQLPALPFEPLQVFFTNSPPSPDCLVVAIAQYSYSIGVHKLGENHWNNHDYESPYYIRFGIICSNPIFYQGLYHCLDSEGKIAAFDVNDIEHSFTWIHCKFPSRKFTSSLIQLFLVENGGELFVVTIASTHAAKIHVFKLNMTTKRLEPVQSLRKNMLFISTGASFSIPAVIRGTCNTVYYGMNFRLEDSDLFCFYSLLTRKHHSFFANLSSRTPCYMKLLQLSSWLYPCELM